MSAQGSLLPDAPLAPGEVRQIGAQQVRNFDGYHQSREGSAGPWFFYVTGFSGTRGECGSCSVLLIDGSTRRVPMDARGRIEISGRWRPESSWRH